VLGTRVPRGAGLEGGVPPQEQRRQILKRSIRGLVPYAVATALAPVSPYLTLAICAALAVYYAFPIASGMGPSSAAMRSAAGKAWPARSARRSCAR